MVYVLGDKGAHLLAEKFGIDRGKIKWKEKNEEVEDRHIQHTLMISNFRVCVQRALNTLPHTHLLFWEKENREELSDYVYIENGQGREREIAIVPDGFFGMKDTKPKPKIYFFLEADQSTRPTVDS